MGERLIPLWQDATRTLYGKAADRLETITNAGVAPEQAEVLVALRGPIGARRLKNDLRLRTRAVGILTAYAVVPEQLADALSDASAERIVSPSACASASAVAVSLSDAVPVSCIIRPMSATMMAQRSAHEELKREGGARARRLDRRRRRP